MNNLSVNVIFCESFDEENNSIINSFDGIVLAEPLFEKIKMVVIANRTENERYHAEVFVCKLKPDDHEIDKIVNKFVFDIPKEYDEEGKHFINNEFFLLDLDVNKIKMHGEGKYIALVFACKIDDEDYDKEKQYSLFDTELIAASNLKVSLGSSSAEADKKTSKKENIC